MSEAKGIESVKKVIDGLAKLASSGIKVAEDKKISLEDLPEAVAIISAIGPLVDSAKDCPAELSDLSEAEAAELIGHVAAKLSIVDEKAKDIVIASLKVASAGVALVKAIKA